MWLSFDFIFSIWHGLPPSYLVGRDWRCYEYYEYCEQCWYSQWITLLWIVFLVNNVTTNDVSCEQCRVYTPPKSPSASSNVWLITNYHYFVRDPHHVGALFPGLVTLNPHGWIMLRIRPRICRVSMYTFL